MTRGYIIYRKMGGAKRMTYQYFKGYQMGTGDWSSSIKDAKLFKKLHMAKQIASAHGGTLQQM